MYISIWVSTNIYFLAQLIGTVSVFLFDDCKEHIKSIVIFHQTNFLTKKRLKRRETYDIPMYSGATVDVTIRWLTLFLSYYYKQNSLGLLKIFGR